jgi:hypothetical protein
MEGTWYDRGYDEPENGDTEPTDEMLRPYRDWPPFDHADEEPKNGTAELKDETVAPDAERKLHYDERSEHNEPKNGTAKQSEFSNEFYEPGDEKLIADIKASLDRGDPEDQDGPDAED